jgi:hypothetical protein
VEFAGNAVAVGTLDTSGGAASLTTGNAGVEVETLSGANNVTVAQGSVTLTGDSEAFGQTLEVSDGAEVEIEEDAVLGGSVDSWRGARHDQRAPSSGSPVTSQRLQTPPSAAAAISRAV